MRGKRSIRLLGPALLIALAVPPISATGAAAAATEGASVASVQVTAAGSSSDAMTVTERRKCKRFGNRICCKRRGHWRCHKRHKRWHHRNYGHHGKYRHHRNYGRHGKFRHHRGHGYYSKVRYRGYERFDRFGYVKFRHHDRWGW